MTTRRVTLYGAPDCHLCHDARSRLARAQRWVAFEIEDVDVRSDPVLEARFGRTIPVVAVGERILAAGKITEFRILRGLLGV